MRPSYGQLRSDTVACPANILWVLLDTFARLLSYSRSCRLGLESRRPVRNSAAELIGILLDQRRLDVSLTPTAVARRKAPCSCDEAHDATCITA